MKLRIMMAAVVFSATAPAVAAGCTQSFSLGSLGPPDFAFFGNSFSQATQFNDCYSFTLDAAADGVAVSWAWDLSRRLEVNLLTASIHRTTGELIGLVHDFSSPVFSINGLDSGQFRLKIAGEVTPDNWNARPGGTVGYGGVLAMSSARVATPVPEADTLAMLALGLGVVAWASRRKPAAKAG